MKALRWCISAVRVFASCCCRLLLIKVDIYNQREERGGSFCINHGSRCTVSHHQSIQTVDRGWVFNKHMIKSCAL